MPRAGSYLLTNKILPLGLLLTLLASLLVIGCAKPPTKEIADAEAALAVLVMFQLEVPRPQKALHERLQVRLATGVRLWRVGREGTIVDEHLELGPTEPHRRRVVS